MKKPILSLFIAIVSFSAHGQELQHLLDSAIHSINNSTHFFSQARTLIKSGSDSLDFYSAKIQRAYQNGMNDSIVYYGKIYLNHPQSQTQPAQSILVARRVSRAYIGQGVYESALEFAQLGLALAEQASEMNNIAFQLADIAIIYHDFEDFDNGVKYGKVCLQTAIEKGADTRHQAYCLNAIAINFDDWAKPDSALFYHFKVLELKPLPDSLEIQFTFNNIGNTLMKMGDYSRAETFFTISLKLARKHSIPRRNYSLAGAFTNLGQLKKKQKQFSQASIYLDSALYYAEKSSSLEKIRDTYFDIYTFNKERGNFEKALFFQDLYYNLRDSIFKAERLRTVSELEARYQTALKDRQLLASATEIKDKETRFYQVLILSVFLAVVVGLLIVILQLNKSRFKKKREILEKEKEIELRQAAIQAALDSQETERRRFAQDLHDGFGQLISALRLQIDKLEGEKDAEKKQISFEQAEKTIEEMHKEIRNIAFNLMPAVLIKSGIIEALKEFAIRLNQTGKVMVTISHFGIEERMNELQEINLYRVLQEWINNVLKYNSADKIDIQLVKHEYSLTLTIEDNGEGFNASLLENSRGNGWKNIQSRLKLIQAKVEVDTRPDIRGTTLIIDMPLQLSPAKVETVSLKELN